MEGRDIVVYSGVCPGSASRSPRPGSVCCIKLHESCSGGCGRVISRVCVTWAAGEREPGRVYYPMTPVVPAHSGLPSAVGVAGLTGIGAGG